MFHCPGDKRVIKGRAGASDPLRYYQFYRSYVMPSFYEDAGLLTDIKSGGQRYLFLEDNYDKHYYSIGDWDYEPYSYSFWDPLGNFHNKGCTFSFVDGHAEQYRWKDPRTMLFMTSRQESWVQNQVEKGTVMLDNQDFEWLDAHYPR